MARQVSDVTQPLAPAFRPARRHKVRFLFAPDLAFCVSLVTLVYCVFLFNAPRALFRDSDTGWHIVTGERIVMQHRLPHSDPYSFTRSGQPWFAWEWAADGAMGLVYRSAGLPGIVWLYVLAICAVTWIWFQVNWTVGGNFFLACLFAGPMLSTVNLHWLARPHVFSWIFLLASIWYFENAPVRFRLRDGALLVGLAVLWTNLHASFMLLPLVALIYAISHFVRPLIWHTDAAIDALKRRWFLAAAAISATATLINPYGWNLHLHVARLIICGFRSRRCMNQRRAVIPTGWRNSREG